MPQVPPLTLPGATLNAEDLYKDALFDPFGNSSMEILNGGMAAGNIVDVDGSIEPWAMQLGTFAQGYYHGFDRTEFMYGEQMSSDRDTTGAYGTGTQRVVHAGLSIRRFIPFTPSVVMYGFQAWFQHDATYYAWSGTGGATGEIWDWRFKLQSMTGIYENPSKVLYGRLDWGRYSPALGDIPFMREGQWKYVHKSGMIADSGLTKGNFSIQFSMSAELRKQLHGKPKCKTVAGGVWLLALR